MIIQTLFIVLVLGMSGCAIKHPMVVTESYFGELPPYLATRKLPEPAVIIMSEEQEAKVHASRAAYLLGSGSEFSFEIGKITRLAAEQAANRVFEGGVTVARYPSASVSTYLLRPQVTALEWWYRSTKPGYNFQEVAKLELTLTVERGGQRIFSTSVSSGEVGGRVSREAVPLGTEANRVVHHMS